MANAKPNKPLKSTTNGQKANAKKTNAQKSRETRQSWKKGSYEVANLERVGKDGKVEVIKRKNPKVIKVN